MLSLFGTFYIYNNAIVVSVIILVLVDCDSTPLGVLGALWHHSVGTIGEHTVEGYERFVTDSPADQIPTVVKYIKQFQKNSEKAKLWLERAQQRQKAYSDRHRHHVEYEEREKVLLKSSNLELRHLGSRKLLPCWVGPFSVEWCIGLVAYRLALLDSMHTIHPVFHVSRLAKYHTGD